jgi:hypothetical protein
MARSALPAVAFLALVACALLPSAFVSAPAQRVATEPHHAMGLGAAAGLLTAQPAHASMLFDEIIPYAVATSLSILWGIVLGFVLLRLQEAFPE